MSDYPWEVQEFQDAVMRLPGVTCVDTGFDRLEGICSDDLSFVIYSDYPHAVLRRTNGGLEDEAWVHAEIVFDQSEASWRSLEFLAWWVREQSAGGELIQMRPQALPPKGFEVQLGTTLKFIIDLFVEAPDVESVLAKVKEYAARLNQTIDAYSNLLYE